MGIILLGILLLFRNKSRFNWKMKNRMIFGFVHNKVFLTLSNEGLVGNMQTSLRQSTGELFSVKTKR